MAALLLIVVLTWSAPGDDGHVGTAAVYDIRYASDSLIMANWTLATQATGEPTPHVAGTTETFSITLGPGTWWFALRASDEVGNQSEMSNIVSIVVRDTIASCPIGVDGDADASGAVTSGDIIYLVNFCFKGQAPTLPCQANGDVNCSGSVTPADVVYLVGYVFKGAAAPCDICLRSPLPCL